MVKDTRATPFKCPDCGKRGNVLFKVNPGFLHRGPDRQALGVSKGFKLDTKHRTWAKETRVWCECGRAIFA